MFMCTTDRCVTDLQVTVDEIDLIPRCIPRKTTAVHPNGYRQDNWPNYSHSLLRVISIKTMSKWAIDIGGSQYGIFTPLWRWEDYMRSFVEMKYTMKVFPLGTNKAVLKEVGKIPGNPSTIYGMVGDVAGALDEAIAIFEKRKFKLSSLLLLSDNDFNSQLYCALLLNAGVSFSYLSSSGSFRDPVLFTS